MPLEFLVHFGGLDLVGGLLLGFLLGLVSLLALLLLLLKGLHLGDFALKTFVLGLFLLRGLLLGLLLCLVGLDGRDGVGGVLLAFLV